MYDIVQSDHDLFPPEEYQCLAGRVKCNNNITCISASQFCDGYNNCRDHWDESNCGEWFARGLMVHIMTYSFYCTGTHDITDEYIPLLYSFFLNARTIETRRLKYL